MENFSNCKNFVGIDISKDTFDVAVYANGAKKPELKKFTNDRNGFKRLGSWLAKLGLAMSDSAVCMESTGIYSLRLQEYLHDNNVRYCIENPLAIKRSAGIRRCKTDKCDSVMIAEYLRTNRERLNESALPAKSISELQALVRERNLYAKQMAMLKTSLETKDYEPKEIEARKNGIIASLKKEMEKCEKQMMDVIGADESLSKSFKLITSIPGISIVNAVDTIVATRNFTAFDSPRKYACYVGVAPFEHSSGSSVDGGAHVSPMCKSQYKSHLSMAARSAIQHDGWMKAYYKRKMKEKMGGSKSRQDAKRAHAIVINAIKFKLIMRMFAVIRDGSQYKVLNN